jgi:hypothetical protein
MSSKDNQDDILRLLKLEISTYCESFSACLDDMSTSKTVRYIMDFDSAFPYVWRENTNEMSTFKEYGKRLVSNMADHKEVRVGFTPVFTGASFFELLDSFSHHISDLDDKLKRFDHMRRIGEVALRYKNNNFQDIADFLSTELSVSRTVARTELSEILEISECAPVQQYVERANILVGEGGIFRGLRETLDGEKLKILPEDVALLNKLIERMKYLRWNSDPRSDKDKTFHYTVDCLNILSTIVLSKRYSGTSKFVTGMTLRKMMIPDISRNPLVPNVWISAAVLNMASRTPEPKKYIKYAYQEAKELHELLADVHSPKGLNDFYKDKINLFYRNFGRPLNKPAAAQEWDYEVKDKIYSVFSSRESFEDRLIGARDTIKNSGKELAAINIATLEEGLLELDVVETDPVFEKLLRDFFI